MATFLPQAQINVKNRLLDLTGLNHGIDQVGATLRDSRMRENQAVVGTKLASGDYSGAAQSAGAMGDTRQAMGIKQFSTQQQNAEEDKARRLAMKTAGIIQNYIDPIKDPAQRSAAIGRLVTSHPGMLPQLQQAGVDIKNPEAVVSYLKAEASQYVQPMDKQKHDAQMALFRAQTNAANASASQRQARVLTPEDRAQLAQQYGIEPGSPAFQSYVLTGKVGRDEPLTATDRKAILEADKEVTKFDNILSSLDRALELNKDAWSGSYAGSVASARNAWGLGNKNTKATEEFNMIMSRQAIADMAESLKGATTDRELFKFIELAGDSSLPMDLRENYIKQARAKIDRLRNLYSRQADQIRGGSYYKPQSGPQSVPRIGPNDKAVFDALPSGAKFIDPDGKPRFKP